MSEEYEHNGHMERCYISAYQLAVLLNKNYRPLLDSLGCTFNVLPSSATSWGLTVDNSAIGHFCDLFNLQNIGKSYFVCYNLFNLQNTMLTLNVG